jgi:hypothetical protein
MFARRKGRYHYHGRFHRQKISMSKAAQGALADPSMRHARTTSKENATRVQVLTLAGHIPLPSAVAQH